jgi:hypothetical protein
MTEFRRPTLHRLGPAAATLAASLSATSARALGATMNSGQDDEILRSCWPSSSGGWPSHGCSPG